MSARTGRSRGRPPGGRPVADKEAILNAAERVIARDGNGASLDAIAAEAGITKPVVYARVGDRADLSNALAARLSDRIVDTASLELAGRAFDREMLSVIFRSTLETIGAHCEVFLYVTRGAADDTSGQALYLASKSASPLAGLLAGWREESGQDTSVATPWAYAIIGMLNMVALWWIEEGQPDVATLADQLVDLVWPGMRNHG
ncbi:MAG TPA: TetR/AcrR family transcriptional regulator [Acidimicrobiales bacterium]